MKGDIKCHETREQEKYSDNLCVINIKRVNAHSVLSARVYLREKRVNKHQLSIRGKGGQGIRNQIIIKAWLRSPNKSSKNTKF